jgi:hypothetical protein
MNKNAKAVLKAGKTPAHNGRFQRASGFVIQPLARSKAAGKWQKICSAVILAEHLDRSIRRRCAEAVEFG